MNRAIILSVQETKEVQACLNGMFSQRTSFVWADLMMELQRNLREGSGTVVLGVSDTRSVFKIDLRNKQSMGLVWVKMLANSTGDGAPGNVFYSKGDVMQGMIKNGRFWQHYPGGSNWSVPLSMVEMVKEEAQ